MGFFYHTYDYHLFYKKYFVFETKKKLLNVSTLLNTCKTNRKPDYAFPTVLRRLELSKDVILGAKPNCLSCPRTQQTSTNTENKSEALTSQQLQHLEMPLLCFHGDNYRPNEFYC